jgi:aldose 1-epimerase
MKKVFGILLVAFALFSCGNNAGLGKNLLAESSFDTTLNGKKVALYTLTNKNGMAIQITNYGARIVSVWVPSKGGEFKDVAWGYSSIKDYLNATDVYAGPIVGRYGNRIAKGKFTLDGKEYALTLNDHGNHLHGGSNGFWKQVWNVDAVVSSGKDQHITLSYLSANGEEGYPGNLKIKVTYTLSENNELKIQYAATTDKPTVVNPTSHVYFNLHGTSEKSTNTHVLQLFADRYTPTDSLLIPTGEISSVENTPLDFRKPTVIGDRINNNFIALKNGKGYDHNWVLMKKGKGVELAAIVFEPETGIQMSVSTDQPGIQFYSGNFMNGVDTGKYGQKHGYRSGIALETQKFPDAPNHSNFPSTVLKPGEVYSQTSVYGFKVK